MMQSMSVVAKRGNEQNRFFFMSAVRQLVALGRIKDDVIAHLLDENSVMAERLAETAERAARELQVGNERMLYYKLAYHQN